MSRFVPAPRFADRVSLDPHAFGRNHRADTALREIRARLRSQDARDARLSGFATGILASASFALAFATVLSFVG